MLRMMGRPMIGRLRFAGSGLFLSVPGGPLVQAIWPHIAPPQGPTRMTAPLFSTNQSPVASAATAGAPRQTTSEATNQYFSMAPSVGDYLVSLIDHKPVKPDRPAADLRQGLGVAVVRSFAP